MKKDKLVYEAPEAEIIEVRFKEGLLSGSGGLYGGKGAAGKGFSSTDGNINDLTDEDDF